MSHRIHAQGTSQSSGVGHGIEPPTQEERGSHRGLDCKFQIQSRVNRSSPYSDSRRYQWRHSVRDWDGGAVQPSATVLSPASSLLFAIKGHTEGRACDRSSPKEGYSTKVAWVPIRWLLRFSIWLLCDILSAGLCLSEGTQILVTQKSVSDLDSQK